MSTILLSFVYVCHDKVATSPTTPTYARKYATILLMKFTKLHQSTFAMQSIKMHRNVNIIVNKAGTSVIYCAPSTAQRLQRAPLNYLGMNVAYVSVGHYNDAATFGDSLHIICNCIRKSWRFWFPSKCLHTYKRVCKCKCVCVCVCGKFFMQHTRQRP